MVTRFFYYFVTAGIALPQVMEMGIETYNKHCRSIVTRYSKEWEKTIKRLGRWIDFENDYKTMVRNDDALYQVSFSCTRRYNP